MKKIIVLAFILVSSFGNAQKNKKYSDKELVTICKVWGLMKYHHPVLSHGLADADSLLIAALQHPEEPIVIIDNWKAFLDNNKSVATDAPAIAQCKDKDIRNMPADWISGDKNLGKEQKKYLQYLASQNVQYTYYSSKEGSIRYSGQNEKQYKDKGNDENYRLLDLFRAWNVIEYFYPYKYAISKPWDKVLADYIPQFRTTTTPNGYTKTLMAFSASIEDSHARLDPVSYGDVFGPYGLPFTFQLSGNKMVISKLIDAAVCEKYAVKPGDVVEKLEGKTIQQLLDENCKYLGASNKAVQLREAYNYIGRGGKGSFTISGYDKGNKPFTKTVERIDRSSEVWFKDGQPDNSLVRYDEKTQKAVYSVIKDNIGYIEFSMLQTEDIDSLMTAMAATKGIVFDLRGYNGDSGLLKTFDYLFAEPKWWGILTRPDFNKPGSFCWQDYIINPDYKFIGKTNPNAYKGKVVVLVNEYTQSVEEMWSMIFKAIPGVMFIGSQTAGADGNETPIPLIDGRKMIFSGVGIYYPDRTSTQKVGIAVDIEVRPTIKDLQNGVDPLADKAFEVLRKL